MINFYQIKVPKMNDENSEEIESWKDVHQFRVTNITANYQLWKNDGPKNPQSSPPSSWYQDLAKNGINTEYSPKKFHAIIQRIKIRTRPDNELETSVPSKKRSNLFRSLTALIFKSGRVVLTGGTTQEECKKAALRITRRINFSVKQTNFSLNNFRITNFVGLIITPYRINIEELYLYLLNIKREYRIKKIIYEPIRFTGLRIRFKKIAANQQAEKKEKVWNSPACLIFINGKIIVTGFVLLNDMIFFCQRLCMNIISRYNRAYRTL